MLHLVFLEPFLTPLLLLFIGIVLLSGFFLILSLYKKEKEFEKKRESEFSNYDKILTEAHTQAEHIIEQAAGEAGKLSLESEDFTKRINQNIDATFQQIIEKNVGYLNSSSQEMLTSYQSYLQSLKITYQKEVETAIQHIHTSTEGSFTLLQQEIKDKMIGSENGVSKKIADEFAQTQMEINEYKKHKLQEVNMHIDKLIIKVSEEVLGQAIPLSQHQQLIVEALEKAQKEGMFEI